LIPSETATPSPTLTRTPTRTPPPTPTRQESATPTPLNPTQITATAAKVAQVNADAAKRSLEARASSRVYTASRLPLSHRPGSAIPTRTLASPEDFIFQAFFAVPYSRSEGEWDVNVIFRKRGAGANLTQYQLQLRADGGWSVRLDQEGRATATIAEGSLANLFGDAGAGNLLELYVYKTDAYLYLNGVFAGQFDVSAETRAGAIQLMIGDGGQFQIARKTTIFSNVIISAIR
jgi:hypothetical protein